MREKQPTKEDLLFAEGERDAARVEVAELREHLKAANAAYMAAENELAATRALNEKCLAALRVSRGGWVNRAEETAYYGGEDDTRALEKLEIIDAALRECETKAR